MPAQTDSAQRQASGGILLILGLAAVAGLALLLQPFLLPLAVAAVIAVLTHPAYTWLVARVARPSLVALLLTLAIVFVVFLPVIGLLLALLSNLASSFDAGAAQVGGDAIGRLAENELVLSLAGLLRYRWRRPSGATQREAGRAVRPDREGVGARGLGLRCRSGGSGPRAVQSVSSCCGTGRRWWSGSCAEPTRS